ncbi:hypothetical protein EL76_0838 [Escherichia coli G3/10]|nr:hypothetical protein AC98_2204 [Escherichia coli 2-210-07_S4_C2]KDX67798.1 hypothetical protein AD28_2269 [Escherichia coli 2-210-07_S4_C3]KEM86968.1 hypothetical protein AC71_3794 [Escherichia coli 2-222-05_S4_C1]KGM62372.1 hypothetical protein EL76_0838 [Escherichia coli G3/10]
MVMGLLVYFSHFPNPGVTQLAWVAPDAILYFISVPSIDFCIKRFNETGYQTTIPITVVIRQT